MKNIHSVLLSILAIACVSCGISDDFSASVCRNTDFTGIGNEDETMLIITVDKGHGTLKGLEVELAGQPADITSLRLWCGDQILGETVTNEDCGTQHVWCSRKVKAGDKLILKADISGEADEGDRISADIVSMDFIGGNICPDKPEAGMKEVFLKCKCLYRPGEGGSNFWRIPAILQLSDGTLLTVNDKRNITEEDLPGEIDVVYRYSTDGGASWSEMGYIARNGGYMHGYGDPGLAELEDGTVICTFTSGERFVRSRWDNPQRSFFSLSKDHGRTWSEPEEITGSIWGPDSVNPQCRKYHSAFTTSGNSLVLRSGEHKGRMLAASVLSFGDGWNDLCNHVIYTDDCGEHWQVSDLAYGPVGNEAKMVELNDGRILMSIRNPETRKWAISYDGGATWPENGEWTDVSPVDCNGELIRYNDSLLLHSVPLGPGRNNVAVLMSYDEGRTWPGRKVVCHGQSQYSSITVLKDGTIGMFLEKNQKGVELWYVNFSLDWLGAISLHRTE